MRILDAHPGEVLGGVTREVNLPLLWIILYLLLGHVFDRKIENIPEERRG